MNLLEKNFSLGMITPVVLVIVAMFFVVATAILNWSVSERKGVINKIEKNKALQVAEAGISYYKWHLAHDSLDYLDGNSWCCDGNSALSVEDCGGVCGPYVHSYEDYDGDVIGEFSLAITPPEVGSTIINVESSGSLYESANVSKTVASILGRRSLASYSFLSNSPIWIGDDESTVGPLHSNGGIRFDGTCNAEVTSAVEYYSSSSASHSFTGTKPGIWGSTDPEVTKFWSFPEPSIDFDLFTIDMANIRSDAYSDGIYLPSSGRQGYQIIFKSSGYIDIYMVRTVRDSVYYYDSESGNYKYDKETVSNRSFLGQYNMPNNGLIFVEDNVWVEGVVKGRVTVASSKFANNPSNYARIIIDDNITYLSRDGSNSLGLMAEGDVLVPKHAPYNLTIDAMLLSQKGHVYRRLYSPHSVKNNIEVYGGVVTNLFWTWTWVSGSTTTDGYRYTNTIYDSDLTFSPPPSFPTSENFEVLSWDEY